MNIAYFLLPKSRIAYLYDDCTFRQGLEKMNRRGYSAIPVITRSGRYAGAVSEGDFLWIMVTDNDARQRSMRELEQIRIRDILSDNYPPVRITVAMEELVERAMEQNFIPVVDDLDNFVGIVTRRDIMAYLAEQKGVVSTPLSRIG